MFSPLYVFSPIRFLPYTFSPLSLSLLFFYIFPQKNTMPLFFMHNIPKENPLRHRRISPLQGSISMLSLYRPLYNSPDSIPYTFSPLSHSLLFFYIFPQKNTMPLFFMHNIPKENPLRHRGIPPLQGSMLS